MTDSSFHPTPRAKATKSSRLVEAVGLPLLQQLQDSFAALGQVSVVIGTPEGNSITRPTWGSRFSKLIGTSAKGRQELADHMRALAPGPPPSAPPICLYGMALHHTPIRCDGEVMGLIFVGTRSPVWPPEQVLRRIAADYEIDAEDLIRSTQELAAHIGATPEAAHRFADALAGTIVTLARQDQRIRLQLTNLQTVHELAELLAGTLDLGEILHRTLVRVVDVMGVKAAGIRLLNEETGELEIAAVHNLSDEYLGKGALMLSESAIDSAAFAGKTVYIEDCRTDPRIRYPDNATREGIVSGLCVPVAHRGKTLGVLRVYADRIRAFSGSERALLRSIASQAASAIMNSRLSEEKAEADRVQRQILAAGAIQRRMMPARPPDRPGVELAGVYSPSLQLGGDFYDFIELSGGALGVAVADVVGKGMPAALLMASVRSVLRSEARHGWDVHNVVSRVNRHLCGDMLMGEFASMFYAVLYPDRATLTYCNAGHIPPLLLRKGTFIELTAGGLVIGIDASAAFEEATIELRTDDVLVLVTDGVTEALPFTGAPFGRQRLKTSIEKHKGLSAPSLAQEILWDVRRFVGLADQSDDITIVTIKSRLTDKQ